MPELLMLIVGGCLLVAGCVIVGAALLMSHIEEYEIDDLGQAVPVKRVS